MGLLKGPLKRAESTIKVVYSEDPDVRVPENRIGCGWFPLSEALGTSPGATVVTIRGMSGDRRTAVRDVRGEHKQYEAAALACVVACSDVPDDKSKGRGIVEWLDCLALDEPTALALLGLRCLNLSDGVTAESYYAVSRATFGVAVPGEGPDGGSKSPDRGA